ncbi:MAG: peptidoglycan editing factor PgeF [Magnetococcales bacterium]|nr:peptidoglycan editing factor PgeF [Magnetococcales bacterium]
MKNQEIKFVSLKNIATPDGVKFFFTTKIGGNSKNGYEGLNLGLHVGDDPKTVKNNRKALLKALTPKAQELCFINQVHGTKTVVAPFADNVTPDADGVVTNKKHIAIGVMTADCVPILFADVKNRVVGAAHAGWRGAEGGIVESVVNKMQQLGAKTDKIFAIIGPAIHQENYKVDAQFRDRFIAQDKNISGLGCQRFFSYDRKNVTIRFDLPGYVRDRLVGMQLLTQNIVDVDLCTYLNDNMFFSHRRNTTQGEGACGRQMGGIFLC